MQTPQSQTTAIPAETKHAILDAAERLFAEKGFAATSMRHIVQEAGVNVSTVYYHCRSKEELFGAIYERVIARVTDWVQATFNAEGDFRTIVSGLLEKIIAFLAQNPSIPRLVMRMDLDEVPEASRIRRAAYRPLYELVTRVVQRRGERGEIRRLDPALVITASAGVILSLLVELGRESPKGIVDPERLAAVQRHARVFIFGALGLDAPQG